MFLEITTLQSLMANACYSSRVFAVCNCVNSMQNGLIFIFNLYRFSVNCNNTVQIRFGPRDRFSVDVYFINHFRLLMVNACLYQMQYSSFIPFHELYTIYCSVKYESMVLVDLFSLIFNFLLLLSYHRKHIRSR